MNNNVVPFQAKSFPKQGIWRVHAFGEVKRNPHISSEPTVDLFIVPLKSGSDRSIDLNSSQSYDYDRLQSIQIGVGQIAGICVGSLLQDQRRMYRLPDYTLKRFALNAEEDFRRVVRAGTWYNKDGKSNRIIPDSYYKIPTELRNMPCLSFNGEEIKEYGGGKNVRASKSEMTELAQNPTKSERSEKNEKRKTEIIVIPSWAIFQYYYATSSRLSTSLINGELEIGSNQIYNSDPALTYHNHEDGYFYLRLRQRMFDKDARTIARIAADERVTQITKNICNSMIADYGSLKGAFPDVRLPFFGDTEIEVSGKNIKYEGGWFFFVYNIRSCSGEFYYDKLKFDRDNDNQKDNINDPNLEPAWGDNKKHLSKPKAKEDGQKITDDVPPSVNIIETETVLPPRNFLSQPAISLKLPKKLCKYRSEKAEAIIRTRGTKKDLSTGEGESGGSAARLDIKTDPEIGTKKRRPREVATPDFDSMICVLETIQEQESPDFDYNLIPIIEEDEYEPTDFSVFPDHQDGKRIAWSFIPGNPTRRRQAMVAEVIYKNAYFYLFEIERRVNALGNPTENFHTVVVHKSLGEIGEIELEQVLLYMTKCQGVCSGDWEFETLTRKKFKHGWNVESFAKTLINNFREEIASEKRSFDVLGTEPSDFRSISSNQNEEDHNTGLRRLA